MISDSNSCAIQNKKSKEKFKQFITTFTPLGEIERGKDCPQCGKFLSISMFRCKKGTRFGKQGTIRNNKCRTCESGEVVEGVNINIEEMKKKISELQIRIDEYEEKYTTDMNLTAFVLNALLRPHGYDLEKAEKKKNKGEELIILSSKIDNTIPEQLKPRSTLSKL